MVKTVLLVGTLGWRVPRRMIVVESAHRQPIRRAKRDGTQPGGPDMPIPPATMRQLTPVTNILLVLRWARCRCSRLDCPGTRPLRPRPVAAKARWRRSPPTSRSSSPRPGHGRRTRPRPRRAAVRAAGSAVLAVLIWPASGLRRYAMTCAWILAGRSPLCVDPARHQPPLRDTSCVGACSPPSRRRPARERGIARIGAADRKPRARPTRHLRRQPDRASRLPAART